MAFFDDVYSVVKRIPKGQVMTYGQVAKASSYLDFNLTIDTLKGRDFYEAWERLNSQPTKR